MYILLARRSGRREEKYVVLVKMCMSIVNFF